MEQRERFGSRIGFILVSAGCAIGLGNVWKFPYITGQYGGAAFILIYLVFLAALGIPIMLCEFSVGRGSQKGVSRSFQALSPKGTKWHKFSYVAMAGNYLLMMFYTGVGGWMLYYVLRTARGDFDGSTPEQVAGAFGQMMASPGVMIFWMIIAVAICFGICSLGLKKGVENVTKVMMFCLFLLMLVLAIRSMTLDGAVEGLRFYLIPDFQKVLDQGIGNVVFAAMGQAFFTLGLGVGSMAIFGSYLDKDRSLLGEAVNITILDTCVAVVAGLIVIPACFAFGVQPDSGPPLLFITLPNVFNQMPGGRFWGTLFFVFMSFAALTTIVTVFENILSFGMELFGWSRKKSVVINMFLMMVLAIPALLGYNLWAGFQPLGPGSTILDFEDFIVSNTILPLGAMIYLTFCSINNGWGWRNYIAEVNAGHGRKLSEKMKMWFSTILPVVVMIIYLKGYYDKFQGQSTGLLAGWMLFGLAAMVFGLYCIFSKPKQM